MCEMIFITSGNISSLSDNISSDRAWAVEINNRSLVKQSSRNFPSSNVRPGVSNTQTRCLNLCVSNTLKNTHAENSQKKIKRNLQ